MEDIYLSSACGQDEYPAAGRIVPNVLSQYALSKVKATPFHYTALRSRISILLSVGVNLLTVTWFCTGSGTTLCVIMPHGLLCKKVQGSGISLAAALCNNKRRALRSPTGHTIRLRTSTAAGREDRFSLPPSAHVTVSCSDGMGDEHQCLCASNAATPADAAATAAAPHLQQRPARLEPGSHPRPLPETLDAARVVKDGYLSGQQHPQAFWSQLRELEDANRRE